MRGNQTADAAHEDVVVVAFAEIITGADLFSKFAIEFR